MTDSKLSNEAFRAGARSILRGVSDDVSPQAEVSRNTDQDGKDGAYVQAWIWVSNETARLNQP